MNISYCYIWFLNFICIQGPQLRKEPWVFTSYFVGIYCIVLDYLIISLISSYISIHQITPLLWQIDMSIPVSQKKLKWLSKPRQCQNLNSGQFDSKTTIIITFFFFHSPFCFFQRIIFVMPMVWYLITSLKN